MRQKKSIGNLDPKQASQKRDMNTHTKKKEHKNKSKLSKENYRPISIHPNICKVYERCLYDQMSEFSDNIFSKYQCGF